jgi:hypothetical protein
MTDPVQASRKFDAKRWRGVSEAIQVGSGQQMDLARKPGVRIASGSDEWFGVGGASSIHRFGWD